MSSQTSKNNTPSTPATSSKAAQKAPARPKDDSDSEDEEDQLRRQVARTSQELHEQTLRATQLQEELQALRASANVTSTPLDGRERLKLNPPATFDGTPGQLKGYLVQGMNALSVPCSRNPMRNDRPNEIWPTYDKPSQPPLMQPSSEG